MDPTHKIAPEYSPFITPDSLRQATQLMKKFFDMHTKQNIGYVDIDGCQYSGLVQNYGSELITEARKVLMDNAPIGEIYSFFGSPIPTINNQLSFYFDIEYSEMINTPDQQTMLVASLKKDVLIDGYQYKLKYENVQEIQVIRAESWGDEIVHKQKFYKTNQPPKLIMTDNNGVRTTYTLSFEDGNNTDIDYFIYAGKEMEDFISVDEDIHVIETDNLTNGINGGLPFIWICDKRLRTLDMNPDDIISDNVDQNGKPIFTYGTNGHGITYIYPYAYGSDNIPDPGASGKQWFLKAISVKDEFRDSANPRTNYETTVGKIQLVYGTTHCSDVSYSLTCTIDETGSKVILNNPSIWNYYKPEQGDFGYNEITRVNPTYAWTSLSNFINNATRVYDLIPAFKIIFNKEKLHTYNGNIVQNISTDNAVSGIHVDASSEYSYNSIIKKNGVIHELGEFDGLPKYFKYLLDKKTHRSHVEMYAIRDQYNTRNQKAVNKKTAAIILDSAIPQTEMLELDDSLNVVIKYRTDLIDRHLYDTVEESISQNNALSEITFIDKTHFSNERLPGQENNPRFIYHGNRTFSLGMMGFDPETEIARVYVISNDPIKYENNRTIQNPKADRTFARICDIPTKYSQLIHISNIAPTIIIDSEYIRMKANYTEGDKVWNGLSNYWINPYPNKKERFHYKGNSYNLQLWLSPETFQYYYGAMINLSPIIYQSTTLNTMTWTVANGGSDYNLSDEISVMIGGQIFDGIVSSVQDGVVSQVLFPYAGKSISASNLEGRITRFPTTTRGSGSGLLVDLEIDETFWNTHVVRQRSPEASQAFYPYYFYTFRIDEYGFTWGWEMKPNYQQGDHGLPVLTGYEWIQSAQITGQPIFDNPYDESDTVFTNNFVNTTVTRKQRTTDAVYVFDSLVRVNSPETRYDKDYGFRVYGYQKSTEPGSIFGYPPFISMASAFKNIDSDIPMSTYEPSMILTEQINALNINAQDGLYYIRPETTKEHASVSYIIPDKELPKYLLPRFNDYTLSTYRNKACQLLFAFSNNDKGEQPSVFFYDPMKITMNDYQYIGREMYQKVETHDLTFHDYFERWSSHNDCPDGEVIIENGALTRNVYQYREYEMSQQQADLYTSLSAKNRQQLLDYIRTKISKDAEPLKYQDEYDNMIHGYYYNNAFYEDAAHLIPIIPSSGIIYVDDKTDLAYVWENNEFHETRYHTYSKERLIWYIMNNSIPDGLFGKHKIELLRRKDDIVYTVNDGDYKGVGVQPDGGFEILSNHPQRTKGNIDNGGSVNFEILYTFKLDIVSGLDLTNFRIHDNDGIDISPYSLLILNKEFYVFRKTDDAMSGSNYIGNWIKVTRKESDVS